MLKIATWDDYDNIISMIDKFAHSYPFPDIDIQMSKMETIVQGILGGDKSKALILLYLKDEQIVGMLAATTTEMIFNYEKLAHELMWWVEPEHRGGRAGIELFKAFEFWAKKVGCNRVQMSLVESEHAPNVERVYKKFGYTQVERAFLKDI